MPKFTVAIDRPGDMHNLPWRVRLTNHSTGDVSEYRTAGTIDHVKGQAERARRRLQNLSNKPGTGSLY